MSNNNNNNILNDKNYSDNNNNNNLKINFELFNIVSNNSKTNNNNNNSNIINKEEIKYIINNIDQIKKDKLKDIIVSYKNNIINDILNDILLLNNSSKECTNYISDFVFLSKKILLIPNKDIILIINNNKNKNKIIEKYPEINNLNKIINKINKCENNCKDIIYKTLNKINVINLNLIYLIKNINNDQMLNDPIIYKILHSYYKILNNEKYNSNFNYYILLILILILIIISILIKNNI